MNFQLSSPLSLLRFPHLCGVLRPKRVRLDEGGNSEDLPEIVEIQASWRALVLNQTQVMSEDFHYILKAHPAINGNWSKAHSPVVIFVDHFTICGIQGYPRSGQ